MSTNAATEQGGTLEVTDEDLNGPSPDTAESKGSPKTDKSESTSQPKGESDAPSSEAKEKGPGPWDAKLAELGLNDPKFSDFIRAEIQPYITQLEQGGGGEIGELFGGDTEMASVALEILQKAVNDPEELYEELGEVILELNPDLAEEIELGSEDDPEGGYYDEGDESEEYEDERLSYVDDLMRREQEAEADRQYEDYLTKLEERIPGFDASLFSKMVLVTGGDMNAAVQEYMTYHRAPDPTDDAPPTLEGGGTPPPEAPQINSIDDALDSFLAESRAARS